MDCKIPCVINWVLLEIISRMLLLSCLQASPIYLDLKTKYYQANRNNSRYQAASAADHEPKHEQARERKKKLGENSYYCALHFALFWFGQFWSLSLSFSLQLNCLPTNASHLLCISVRLVILRVEAQWNQNHTTSQQISLLEIWSKDLCRWITDLDLIQFLILF